MTKPYHYIDSGLDWVYLANGFKRRDTAYGRGISIDHADDLHEVIARSIIASPQRLRGQEVRFLRSMLDMSQVELAAALGVKRLQVARWEGAREKAMPGPADRALRLFYAGKVGGDRLGSSLVDLLADIDDHAYKATTFREVSSTWQRKAA